MKNVMIFQEFVDKNKYKTEELFNFFRAQIDNSFRFGWKSSDIYICTNLDFSYENVNVVKMKKLCNFNKFANKVYGICELLEENIITDNFWFHDFDDWQINQFDFPSFEGDVAMAKYVNFTQWCLSDIFIKPSSLNIWQLFYEFTESNRSNIEPNPRLGDDAILNFLYNNYPEIQPRFHQLNSRYCVGCTQFDMRYNAAELPVYIIAMKPNKDNRKQFQDKNLLSDDLLNIFKKHNLNEN